MVKIKTVYDHIQRNNLKTFFLLLLFPTILWLMSAGVIYIYAFMQQNKNLIASGMAKLYSYTIPALIIFVLWFVLAYLWESSALLSISNAKKADETEYRQLHRAVENVAMMAGLPKPRVFIIDNEGMNAFTTGTRPENAMIAFTTGIVKKLNSAELQGVIAHEMAHIGNRDVLMNLTIAAGIGSLALLSEISARAAFAALTAAFSDREEEIGFYHRPGPSLFFFFLLGFLALFFGLFAVVFAPIVHLMISRTHEYNADATGAKITHNPLALADALHKIDSDSQIKSLPQAASFFCIVQPKNPSQKGGSLFDTHPPIAKRIQRLKSMV